MGGCTVQYLLKESEYHPTVVRMEVGMYLDNLGKRAPLFLTDIPIPTADSITVTRQGIEMSISHLGIIPHQRKELFKFLYLMMRIIRLRVVYISNQNIHQIARRVQDRNGFWNQFYPPLL